MIKRTFDITARIEQGNIPYCFQVVQNDKDVYALHIRITEGDKEIDYTQVSDATITFALANGAVVQSDPERLVISSGGITYEMGTTEISCPGKVTASIQLFGEDGGRLTTARFQFEVVADLITPGAVQSESRFPILQQLVADVEQLKQDIVDLQIPDNSIMDEKLSNAAGQIKQRVAAHLADSVTDSDGAHGLKIESGSFTPYMYGSTTAGTNTYSLQVGSYVKIDKMVFVQGYISMATKDAAMAGSVLIGGLPYVAASGKTASFSIGEYRYISRAADKQITARVSGGSNFIELRLGGINSSEGLAVSTINANTVIVFSGAYETAA